MSDLLSHRAELLLSYWNAKRGRRAMCAREDIDPVEIPGLLSNIVLVDVIDDGDDFRFRLVGSEVRLNNRTNSVGKLFSELFPDKAKSRMWRDYTRVVVDQRPVACRIPYSGPDEYVREAHHLLLPLSKDRVTVNMVLVLVEFDRAEIRYGGVNPAQAANPSVPASAEAA